jgi:hypothetical protein
MVDVNEIGEVPDPRSQEQLMLDALADLGQPQVKSPVSSGAPAQEVQEAIRKAFPYEGELRVRRLWSGHDTEKYRANWFGLVDGRMRVAKSLFLSVARTKDGLVVQDATALR